MYAVQSPPADSPAESWSVSLNGVWEFEAIEYQPATGPATPAAATGQARAAATQATAGSAGRVPTTVPGLWGDARRGAGYDKNYKLAGGIYRRKFDVPAGFGGAVLEFGAIRWGGQVRVNGKPAGRTNLGWAACSFDVSGLVKPGSNELEVECTGWPSIERFDTGDPKIPVGAGNWFGNKLGGLAGNVTLRMSRGAYIANVQIHPRYKGPSCDVVADVWTFDKPFSGNLAVQILSDDKSRGVSKVFRQAVSIEAGKKVRLTMKDVQAPGGELWDNDNPVMSRAVVWLEKVIPPISRVGGPRPEATKSPGGSVAPFEFDLSGIELDGAFRLPVSVREVAFGFRQVQVEGNRFYLNGRPIALHGYSGVWAYSDFDIIRDPARLRRHQVDLVRRANARVFRSHQDPLTETWLDMCDRNGILVVCEMPNFPDVQRLAPGGALWSLESPYDRPEFVENLFRELAGIIEYRFNHPSIVVWSASNEGNGFGDWERARLEPFVRDVDPTRPVMFSSDVTRDFADSHNFLGNWYGTHGEFERSLRELAKFNTDRVLGCTEFGQFSWSWRYFGMPKDPSSDEALRMAQAQVVMEEIEAMRRLRFGAIMPFLYPGQGADRLGADARLGPVFHSFRNAMAPLAVSLDWSSRNVLAGQTIDVPVWVMSDDDKAGGKVHADVLVLADDPLYQWKSSPPADKILSRQCISMKVTPWEAAHRTARVTMPSRPGRYTMVAVLWTPSGEPVISQRPLRVHAALPAPAKKLKVGVIETDGRIEKWLAGRGHEVVLACGGVKPDVIIIGEGQCNASLLRLYGFNVSQRVKVGGTRLVLLEQQAWSEGGLEGRILQGLTSTPVREPLEHVFPLGAMRKAVGPATDFWRLNGEDNIAMRVRLEAPKIAAGPTRTLGTGQPDSMATQPDSPAATQTAATRTGSTQPAGPASPWRPLMVGYSRGGEKMADWAMVHRIYGAGEVIGCQVPLTGRLDRTSPGYDPVAERLMAFLVEGTVPQPAPSTEPAGSR